MRSRSWGENEERRRERIGSLVYRGKTQEGGRVSGAPSGDTVEGLRMGDIPGQSDENRKERCKPLRLCQTVDLGQEPSLG